MQPCVHWQQSPLHSTAAEAAAILGRLVRGMNYLRVLTAVWLQHGRHSEALEEAIARTYEQSTTHRFKSPVGCNHPPNARSPFARAPHPSPVTRHPASPKYIQCLPTWNPIAPVQRVATACTPRTLPLPPSSFTRIRTFLILPALLSFSLSESRPTEALCVCVCAHTVSVPRRLSPLRPLHHFLCCKP